MDTPDNTRMFDVRPWLTEGREPFDALIDTWGKVPPKGYLVVRAAFRPLPLIAHFSAMGIAVQPSEPLPGDHWIRFGPKP